MKLDSSATGKCCATLESQYHPEVEQSSLQGGDPSHESPGSRRIDTVEAMKSQLDVIAHIQALPGEEAFVRKVLEGQVAPTRLEDGCLRYDLFVDLDDAAKFTFVEEWTNAETLFKHSRSSHIAASRARLEGKVAGPAWVQKLKQII